MFTPSTCYYGDIAANVCGCFLSIHNVIKKLRTVTWPKSYAHNTAYYKTRNTGTRNDGTRNTRGTMEQRQNNGTPPEHGNAEYPRNDRTTPEQRNTTGTTEHCQNNRNTMKQRSTAMEYWWINGTLKWRQWKNNFYHSCLDIKIQQQYTLEQYYYIALYRQQILTVWLGRE